MSTSLNNGNVTSGFVDLATYDEVNFSASVL